jgi:PAS domain S-box-containing protein
MRESGVRAHDAFLVLLDDATRPLDAPEEITVTAARLLGEHLDVDRCAYADVEADEDTFNLTGDYNRGVPSIVGRYRFAQFGSECRRLMRAGAAYVVEDSETDIRTDGVRGAYRQTLIRAVICVPLLKSGRFVAAMAVHQTAPRRWASQEIDLVQRVANRCWESIERARIGRELRESEARLRAALEASRQVAWEYAPAAQEVRCSHTVAGVLGLAAEHGRVPLAEWERCVHSADRAARMAVVEGARIACEPYSAEYRWCRPDDGAVIWVEESGSVLCDPHGAVLAMRGMIADITLRRTAENERERFFSLGLDLLVVADFAGRLLRVNPAWERVLGWTAHELIAQPWLSLVHPDDRAASVAELERLYAGHGTTEFENRYRGKDGRWRWLDWKVRTHPGERLLYGAANDVTERKRREQRDAFLVALDDAIRALGDPQDIAAVALGMLADHVQADRSAYCLIAPDGDAFVAKVHQRLAGMPPMEGTLSLRSFGLGAGSRFAAGEPAVCGDAAAEGIGDDVRGQLLRHGIRSFLMVPLRRGEVVVAAWALHQAQPREWQPDESVLVQRVAERCWEAVERAQAVNGLRQQWHLFDSALSHTPDFTYIFDTAGRFVYVNRALLALWQKRFDEAVGKDFFGLDYPPELAARLQGQIQEVIATRSQVRDQTPYTDPQGVTRHYEYIFVPILADDGTVSAVAGSTRDITDRLRSEQELRLANAALSRTNRELEQFAYIASHDLQEPLRMVSSYVSLLERRAGPDLSEAARGYIAQAIKGTSRMQRLISDLLTFARLGEARPFAVVDLGQACAAAVAHLSSRIDEAQATVVGTGLPTVVGDEVQLTQLFQNLIGNAIKFRAPQRPVRIEITAEESEGAWTITVRDNGIGISEDERARIFEVFHRGHAAGYEGTGLGLAICKRIVERHGGGIAVESQEGVGSAFIIRLPIAATQAGEGRRSGS